MASPSFALTKIQAPRPRAGLVRRESLEQRLAEAALAKRLVLLAAPAGFGKTAALTGLIPRLAGRAAVAWVAVDSGDDPLGLLACLCAALEPLDPPWRTDPEALVAMAGGSRSDRRAVTSELLNTLAACDVERGLIVVDDAHRIRDPAVFEFLDLLLERLPPQWGVVLSTRTEPPLALARLRAHDELAEFRERDLRFDLDEVRALLPQLPAHVDPASTSRRLLERTQGWAVGLRLAVNSLAASPADAAIDRRQAGVADSSSDRHVFDYLLAEVLSAMPPELRAFLLRCSVLSELTSARCAAVAADPRAAHWLEEIERRGLFVSVLEGPRADAAPARPVPRFPPGPAAPRDAGRAARAASPCRRRRARPGAADRLPDPRRRLDRGRDRARGSRRPDHHHGGRRAGAAPAGPVPAAAACAFRPARAYPLPLRLGPLGLAEHARGGGAGAAAPTRAPATRLGAWRAGLYEAISYGSFGFTDEARRRVDEPPPEPLGIDDRAFLAMTRTYQTFDEGRLDVLGQRYREVIDALESSTNIPLWYHCVPRSMQCGMPGMDGPLARFAAGALRVLPDMPTPLRALALALRGWEELSAGKVAVAAASVELADSDARWLGPPPNVRVFVYALLPILHALYGRAAEARSALDELMKTFDDPDVGYRPGSFVHVYYSLHRVRIADMLGDVESARALFAQVPDDPRPLNETMRRVLASHRAATMRAPRRARRPRRRGDRRLRRGPRPTPMRSASTARRPRCGCGSRSCSSAAVASPTLQRRSRRRWPRPVARVSPAPAR